MLSNAIQFIDTTTCNQVLDKHPVVAVPLYPSLAISDMLVFCNISWLISSSNTSTSTRSTGKHWMISQGRGTPTGDNW